MIDRRTLKIQNDEFTILLNNAISTKLVYHRWSTLVIFVFCLFLLRFRGWQNKAFVSGRVLYEPTRLLGEQFQARDCSMRM